MKCLVSLFVNLVMLASIFAPSMLVGQDQVQPADIQKWIAELNSRNHVDRENATKSLRQAGEHSIPFLWQAVESKEPEVRSRAEQILEEFFNSVNSDDEQIREATLASVMHFAKSGDLAQARLAKRLLGKRNQDVAKWITEQQQGIVSYGNSRLDRPIVDVQLDRTRGIDPGFYSDSLRDSDFARIGTLRELRSLTLEYRTTFSDDALKHLKDLKKLETLNLSRTSLTGSGLRHIAGLPNLRTLNLNGCPRINDDEMKSLSRATSLKKISLEGTSRFLAIG